MAPSNPFERLIERLCAGDVEAIGEMYSAYGETLRRCARAKLRKSSIKSMGSQDVVDSVFKSLISDVKNGTPLNVESLDHLLNLLKLLVSHKITDEIKKALTKKRGGGFAVSNGNECGEGEDQGEKEFHALLTRTVGGDVVANVSDHRLNPLEQTVIKESIAQLKQKLDAEDWDVLERRYVQNQPYEEIAAVLGITVVTARMRVHRARERARPLLESMG